MSHHHQTKNLGLSIVINAFIFMVIHQLLQPIVINVQPKPKHTPGTRIVHCSIPGRPLCTSAFPSPFFRSGRTSARIEKTRSRSSMLVQIPWRPRNSFEISSRDFVLNVMADISI
ncbi:hypothetical protein CT1718 [Chlorobaculum tepidum TLS]|uniref:Uncharacterized protein n=1 Tax=Chlorobaculum tepidum (strain ATCC 49652 / DSM 12025 / NBRC 103806 / TLS) TaxID=194439 RepID=Q8KBR6_CHLTE|nr:hypothetical protein CT1718 [Chlorobaculum tepidum TLS]